MLRELRITWLRDEFFCRNHGKKHCWSRSLWAPGEKSICKMQDQLWAFGSHQWRQRQRVLLSWVLNSWGSGDRADRWVLAPRKLKHELDKFCIGSEKISSLQNQPHMVWNNLSLGQAMLFLPLAHSLRVGPKVQSMYGIDWWLHCHARN